MKFKNPNNGGLRPNQTVLFRQGTKLSLQIICTTVTLRLHFATGQASGGRMGQYFNILKCSAFLSPKI